jgi:DNA modification methylase
MIHLYNADNVEKMDELIHNGLYKGVDLVYADCIYESKDFTWLWFAIDLLKPNGILMVQTDYHTVADYKKMLDGSASMIFVNWLIYKQEWGGVPRNKFAQKHDDVLVYCKGDSWKWYGDRIQIPKATAGTKLDKKGTGLKTPCSVFDDLGNFSTLDKERVKTEDGKNIQWQKPLKFLDRLFLPFTDEEDLILDPFLGSGSTSVWCARNNRHCIGIEYNRDVFKIAKERIEKEF